MLSFWPHDIACSASLSSPNKMLDRIPKRVGGGGGGRRKGEGGKERTLQSNLSFHLAEETGVEWKEDAARRVGSTRRWVVRSTALHGAAAACIVAEKRGTDMVEKRRKPS